MFSSLLFTLKRGPGLSVSSRTKRAFGLLLWSGFVCQSVQAKPNLNNRLAPKLVVGLVIDQMRYDFLYRYQEHYRADGFKRLLREGHSCENMMINYLPSYTAPGHTAIYTGSVPALHGICGNDWIDQASGKLVYCTDDASVQAVGGNERAGRMSPQNLLSTTITDELRLSNVFQSKVIAISLKDRASILPGGHLANAAYWMDDSNGVFMTSTYYMKSLPGWVEQFNAEQQAKKLMANEWNLTMPLEAYRESTPDNTPYEGRWLGEAQSIFPHKTSVLKPSEIKKTPFGNSILMAFAKRAIQEEKLGQGHVCDFLSISCSSTDYIGHQFGPDAIETEDTYLRLDEEIASLLDFLDQQIGEGNYTLFLSADHGVAHNPMYLKDHQVPAGVWNGNAWKDTINNWLNKQYHSTRLVRLIDNNAIWLNHQVADSLQVNLTTLRDEVTHWMEKQQAVQGVLSADHIGQCFWPQPLADMMRNGYQASRCGDVLFVLKPGWLETAYTTGTTHGTWNPYDTHIPMVWFGWGIRKGVTHRMVSVTDIAPTLASLLHIQMPNACTGHCMEDVLLQN